MNLEKYIIQLLEKVHQVTLPSLGKIELEFISVQSDSITGKTIPPKYTLFFTQQHKLDDCCLVNEIAISENLNIEKSKEMVSQIISDWKNILKTERSLYVENLGTFTSEKEKVFFTMAHDCFVNYKNFGLPSL